MSCVEEFHIFLQTLTQKYENPPIHTFFRTDSDFMSESAHEIRSAER